MITVRRGVSLPNVGDPEALVAFGREVDEEGWDALLLWDGYQHEPEPLPTVDPWVLLGGLATVTSRVRLGTGITPLTRRRPWKLAKEVITLDHLSAGRAVLGVGLGAPPEQELAPFGEVVDLGARAARTDEGLAILDAMFRGEPIDHHGEHFEARTHLPPASVQQPRPPVWIAATPPHRKPLERAARWDGVLCNIDLAANVPYTPDQIGPYLGDLAGRADFEVAVFRHPHHPPAAYEDVGVTMLIESWWPWGDDWVERFRRSLRSRAADYAG